MYGSISHENLKALIMAERPKKAQECASQTALTLLSQLFCKQKDFKEQQSTKQAIDAIKVITGQLDTLRNRKVHGKDEIEKVIGQLEGAKENIKEKVNAITDNLYHKKIRKKGGIIGKIIAPIDAMINKLKSIDKSDITKSNQAANRLLKDYGDSDAMESFGDIASDMNSMISHVTERLCTAILTPKKPWHRLWGNLFGNPVAKTLKKISNACVYSDRSSRVARQDGALGVTISKEVVQQQNNSSMDVGSLPKTGFLTPSVIETIIKRDMVKQSEANIEADSEANTEANAEADSEANTEVGVDNVNKAAQIAIDRLNVIRWIQAANETGVMTETNTDEIARILEEIAEGLYWAIEEIDTSNPLLSKIVCLTSLLTMGSMFLPAAVVSHMALTKEFINNSSCVIQWMSKHISGVTLAPASKTGFTPNSLRTILTTFGQYKVTMLIGELISSVMSDDSAVLDHLLNKPKEVALGVAVLGAVGHYVLPHLPAGKIGDASDYIHNKLMAPLNALAASTDQHWIKLFLENPLMNELVDKYSIEYLVHFFKHEATEVAQVAVGANVIAASPETCFIAFKFLSIMHGLFGEKSKDENESKDISNIIGMIKEELVTLDRGQLITVLTKLIGNSSDKETIKRKENLIQNMYTIGSDQIRDQTTTGQATIGQATIGQETIDQATQIVAEKIITDSVRIEKFLEKEKEKVQNENQGAKETTTKNQYTENNIKAMIGSHNPTSGVKKTGSKQWLATLRSTAYYFAFASTCSLGILASSMLGLCVETLVFSLEASVLSITIVLDPIIFTVANIFIGGYNALAELGVIGQSLSFLPLMSVSHVVSNLIQPAKKISQWLRKGTKWVSNHKAAASMASVIEKKCRSGHKQSIADIDLASQMMVENFNNTQPSPIEVFFDRPFIEFIKQKLIEPTNNTWHAFKDGCSDFTYNLLLPYNIGNMYDVEKWQETHSIKSIMQWVIRGAPTPLSEPMIMTSSNEETKPITSLIDELGGIYGDNIIREIMSIIKIYSELTKEEQDRQLSRLQIRRAYKIISDVVDGVEGISDDEKWEIKDIAFKAFEGSRRSSGLSHILWTTIIMLPLLPFYLLGASIGQWLFSDKNPYYKKSQDVSLHRALSNITTLIHSPSIILRILFREFIYPIIGGTIASFVLLVDLGRSFAQLFIAEAEYDNSNDKSGQLYCEVTFDVTQKFLLTIEHGIKALIVIVPVTVPMLCIVILSAITSFFAAIYDFCSYCKSTFTGCLTACKASDEVSAPQDDSDTARTVKLVINAVKKILSHLCEWPKKVVYNPSALTRFLAKISNLSRIVINNNSVDKKVDQFTELSETIQKESPQKESISPSCKEPISDRKKSEEESKQNGQASNDIGTPIGKEMRPSKDELIRNDPSIVDTSVVCEEVMERLIVKIEEAVATIIKNPLNPTPS